MEFQVHTTSGNIKKYISKLAKYDLNKRMGMEYGFECENYYIKLNDLAELVKFQKQIGEELVLNGNSIEIYDSYRE